MKLLFVVNNLHIGGIQRALVNLLNEISEEHSVTLFVFYPTGAFLDELGENINVVCANKFTRIMGMSDAEAKAEGFFTWGWRSFWTVMTRVFGIKFVYGLLPMFQKADGEYDAAVSYMQNSAYRYFYGGCNEFVIKSVKAKKKISFIHCDFKRYFGNNDYNKGYYKNFDKIACVSDSCREVFLGECPMYRDKAVTVRNVYNFSDMLQKAEKFEAERSADRPNLFTAARISEEKGIFRMIDILGELKREGKSFIWRVAGGGPLYDEAVKKAKEKGLSEDIVFLGEQENPYPYYKAADMLLVPSYDEAAPMVFGEAMCFGLPVFTTDTTSAEELVGKPGFGVVCENDDAKIKQALSGLLEKPDAIYNMRYKAETDNKRALSEFKEMIS